MAFARKMVHHGRDRIQIGPWKESGSIASLVPFPARTSVDPKAIVEAVRTARALGFSETYTAAMAPAQAEPFYGQGFELVEELFLLQRRLDGEPAADRSVLRRGRRSDYDTVLEFDRLAFDDFWQFDRRNLIDAMRATPRHRFVVTKTDPVVGYHITGLSSTNAYLQRVAVAPRSHGEGWGTVLVHDALRWAWRNGATLAHVNTQVTNRAAVALYEKCGFHLVADRLQVLHCSLV